MAGPADPQPLERNLMMALSDAAAREMANVLQKHVNQKALVLIIDELLEIRGDKDFREIIEKLVYALRSSSPIGKTPRDGLGC